MILIIDESVNQNKFRETVEENNNFSEEEVTKTKITS